MYDGNYVIASRHKRPWKNQLNLLIGYLSFYNPWWLLMAWIHRKTKVKIKPAAMQVIGMLGAMQSIRRTIGWAFRLRFCRITRLAAPPTSRIPIRRINAQVAGDSTMRMSVPPMPVSAQEIGT